jgi:A/G-specific adenine glycosylase
MRRELLEWYDRNKRNLPWRQTSDPYAIWVSEIMLQQTRVAVVVERYKAFLEKFPTVSALAWADEQEVLAVWSGLGYYRRARMLLKAAKFVVSELKGEMPTTSEALRDLPGIGSYTAAAIASIAHGEAVAVVDGNVERVLSRLNGWESADVKGVAAMRRKVTEFAAALVDPKRPGDYNQALMELGATVCTPRNPQCLMCPWARECKTLGEHGTPKRAPMTSKDAACVLAVRESAAASEVLLEQRAATNTVMPGLWELPRLIASDAAGLEILLTVRHAIMQVNYVVRVYSLPAQAIEAVSGNDGQQRWVPLDQANTMALTGLARKVLTQTRLLKSADKNRREMFAAPATAEVV